MGRDPSTNHEGQELAGAVCRVGDQPLRLETEPPFRAIDHHRRGGDLVIGARRRRLDIDDHGMLDVDQIS